jgi:hypothetical protein
MKTRIYLVCLLALFPSMALAQLPENFSYGRYLTGVEDQLRQGPCESFAAAGGVEALHNLFHSGAALNRIDLSEREVYVCGGNPTKGVGTALNYIRDFGVIPRSCYPMPAVQCLEQYADQGPWQVVNETDANGNRTRNCPAAQTSCGSRYKANHLQLTTQMTTNDGIKRALLEYGPIVIGIDDGGAIHSAYHGYLLYGWQTQNGAISWLLRDSWPCFPRNISSNVNLAAIFSAPGARSAYALTSVSKEIWNGTAWQPQSQTIQPFELEQGKQSAIIVPPANSCMNQGQYSVAGALPAGSSITGWSVRTSNYNYYSDATISSTGVLSGNGADMTVIATLQRANGMRENITLPVSTVGVPHMVDVQSYCPNNHHREIDLRLWTRTLAGYSYTQAINIPPSTDGSYYTIGNGTWFVHLVTSRTQAITYGTTVTVTQNGNPACSRTTTVPNRHVVAMPCSYGW